MRASLIATAAVIAMLFVTGAAVKPSGNFKSDPNLTNAVPWSEMPRDDHGPLRFAVIGDRTGVARPGVFAQAMKQIGWLEPDFIIAVGDLIEGYTVDPVEVGHQWDQLQSFVRGSGRPFIFVPGNHDISDPMMLAAWRERFGAEFYSFTFKGALFIVLDTEDPPLPMTPAMRADFYQRVQAMTDNPDAADKAIADRLAQQAAGPTASAGTAPANPFQTINVANFSERQIGFLRDTLARHPSVRWTFVFFHKPAWTLPSPNWVRIESLLQNRRCTVFAGHHHYYAHTQRNGHDYFEMATTGAAKHRLGPGTMDHAMFVTLGSDGPHYANIKMNGLADADNQTGQTRAY